jgi:hypothetical protein
MAKNIQKVNEARRRSPAAPKAAIPNQRIAENAAKGSRLKSESAAPVAKSSKPAEINPRNIFDERWAKPASFREVTAKSNRHDSATAAEFLQF